MSETRMSARDVFILSEQALAEVISRIRPDRWEERKPDWFQTGGQGDASLREIVNYHAYDSAWVPDVLDGKTVAEVGDRYEHVKTAPDPDYRTYSEAAVAAARELDDLDRTVHLSYGDFPAREYFRHVTSFRGFRAFDLSRWVGGGTQLPPDPRPGDVGAVGSRDGGMARARRVRPGGAGARRRAAAGSSARPIRARPASLGAAKPVLGVPRIDSALKPRRPGNRPEDHSGP